MSPVILIALCALVVSTSAFGVNNGMNVGGGLPGMNNAGVGNAPGGGLPGMNNAGVGNVLGGGLPGMNNGIGGPGNGMNSGNRNCLSANQLCGQSGRCCTGLECMGYNVRTCQPFRLG